MTTVFHARTYSRFIEIKGTLRRKKLHRTNQGSNVVGGTFSNRVNLRASIQVITERGSQKLKKMIFLHEQTHPFPHNNTGVIRVISFN